MKLLVTGGLGYIGSIVARQLREAGHDVVIIDHVNRNSIERVQGIPVIQGDISDFDLVCRILREHNIEAVLHFAAYIEAGESMQNPGKYFSNNTVGSLQLLKAMTEVGVKKLVFSSTAALYGNPEEIPIKETAAKKPVNAYGESKLMVENILRWYDQIHELRFIAIRYFNAAGALLDGSLGEAHQPETHLIPNILKAVKENQLFKLFGNDYPTFDGTCVRDYIHVLDLASAHILALDALVHNHPSDVYNAGTGNGYSNKQIIEAVEKNVDTKINIEWSPRRPGDPAVLIADSSKLQQEFSWKPQFSDIDTIISSAWRWFNK